MADEEKKPYHPYGYNTPDKTNFSETEEAEEVIVSADDAQQSDYKDSRVKPEDFDKAKEQLERGKKIEEEKEDK
ncbi:MAG: hypothetical protein MR008_01375 [Aerococcus sp.]|nr:hypothetical protein [Aerococcus sp.]